MNVEEWVQEHRRRGHHPYPSPTADNPERWLCECPDTAGTAVWRILTPRQIEQKFAHLGVAAERRKQRQRRVDRAKMRALDDLIVHLDGLLAHWEDGIELPYGAVPTVARGFAAQLREVIHDPSNEEQPSRSATDSETLRARHASQDPQQSPPDD